MEVASFTNQAKILNWDCYWKPFQFDLQENWKKLILSLNGSSWPVKSFVKSNVKVRGILHVSELSKDVILIAPEIISKSAKYRKIFRIIIHGKFALSQIDKNSYTQNIFLDYICPLFNIQSDQVKEIRINAMKIRKLSKIVTPTMLTLLVNFQTAGVQGLEHLTLTGDNVIRGIKTLYDRQEVDLKADSIGPWIDIESDKIRFTMGKGIILKDTSEKSIEILVSSLF